VADGVEWKDEYTMGWHVVLAKGCTVCTPDGARHGRTRIGAFRSTPLAVLRNSNKTVRKIGIISGFQLSCMEHNPGRNIDGEEDYDLCL
jgi:hypothetical protein